MKVAFFLVVLALISLNCSATPSRKEPEHNPWGDVLTPSSGNMGSVGFYSAGCLDGAIKMAWDGPGYQVMRLSRHRYYGRQELLDFIARLTEQTVAKKVGVLLIGDMSMPRGGPMPTGHASHQIGLDVDIWYWINPDAQYRPLTPEERENLSSVSVVDLEKQEIKRDVWRPEHVEMLKIASSLPGVERIFVNPVIKRELCQTIPASERGWLHNLRPWFGHDDHFHVRLKCVEGDKYCKPQEPVPPGDGCDQLDWWFTDEARKQEAAPPVSPRPLPILPELCSGVLKE